MAAMNALIIGLFAGPWVIRRLRALKIGQPVRGYAMETHLSKTGTPTMGGVLILLSIALSTRVEVTVKREGQVYEMAFENGDKASELAITGTCGRRTTGTRVRFWPDASYFDSPKFSVSRLVHLLKAKAVLCPGLTISFEDKQSGERLDRGGEALETCLALPEKTAGLDRAEVRYRLAQIRWRQGNPAAARAEAQAALALSPDHVGAKTLLAQVP
jgi:hypothetical protein